MKDTKYDVIVSGGGLAGVASFIAAGREGLDVLLIERYGFLGGMATAGLVILLPHTVPGKPNGVLTGLI